MRWPWSIRGPTLAEYAAAYLATARPRLAPSSYVSRETALRLQIGPRLGSLPLRSVGRQHVRGFIAGLLEAGLGPRTVGHILAMVKVILAEAVKDGLIEANPAAGTWREYRLGHRGGPPKHLTTEQLQALTAVVARSGAPWDTLIGLIWRTGLRRGEALALRWNDVNLDGASLTVRDTLYPDRTLAGRTKTGRSRVVDLSPAAVDLLARHRAWTREEAFRLGIPWPEWVFWGPAGRPILPAVLNQRFARWRRWAGLPGHLVVHSLRHTYAVRALEAGARERYVQQQMGHSSITITVDLYGEGARLLDSKCLERMEL